MNRRIQLAVKHILDRLLAAGLLCFLLPALLMIAAAILIESGRPILFVQLRVGQSGRLFQILKFRDRKSVV